MARREPSQEFVIQDVAWEDDEITKPEAVAAPAAKAGIVNAEHAARLRKMIEFAQWERVAMVRFGIASAAWAAASCEPIPISRKAGTGPDVDEVRRTWERAREIVKGNHEALEKTLDELGRALNLTGRDSF